MCGSTFLFLQFFRRVVFQDAHFCSQGRLISRVYQADSLSWWIRSGNTTSRRKVTQLEATSKCGCPQIPAPTILQLPVPSPITCFIFSTKLCLALRNYLHIPICEGWPQKWPQLFPRKFSTLPNHKREIHPPKHDAVRTPPKKCPVCHSCAKRSVVVLKLRKAAGKCLALSQLSPVHAEFTRGQNFTHGSNLCASVAGSSKLLGGK